MMFDRFSESCRQACNIAGTEALAMRAEEIGCGHLLIGLAQVELAGAGICPVAELFNERGLTVETLREQVRTVVATTQSRAAQRSLPFAAQAAAALQAASAEAQADAADRVESHHLLIALLSHSDDGAPNPAQQALAALNVDTDALRQQARTRLQPAGGPVDGVEPAAPVPAKAGSGAARQTDSKDPLATYCRNLNALAREGQLAPVIERDAEMRRVMEALTRRGKNNPVLVGEPGIGKTAIVEGLAVRIEQRDRHIPFKLRSKQIYAVDLAAMLAGTRYRGEFEERLKATVHSAKADPDVVLFIDELHTLLGAGSAEGSLDAATMLKPDLARGEIQVIGATTLAEYRKHIERDAALERRFQKISVEPPSVQQTVQILGDLRDRYQTHHRLVIDDSALNAAARLTDRYVTDRHLPDKAIDALDAACSRLAFDQVQPQAAFELDEHIGELERQIEASDVTARLELGDRLKDLEARRAEFDEGLLHGEDGTALRLTDATVAEIVSEWTKVPVHKLSGDELALYRDMEVLLGKRVVGQSQAIETVARTMRRARAGLSDPKRPSGSMLFLGPTGVGKTELARALAELVFGDEDAMVRIDMSEYMEKHSVARLVGSPPGYVGHKEGGQLTEAIHQRPYSVLLLDEIEKAHEDVFNILLQVLEDGRLTDSQGRTVDFRHCVVIMTSNLGAEHIAGRSGALGFARATDEESEYAAVVERVQAEVKKAFQPEFINRIDETVVFRKLGSDELSMVLDLLLAPVAERVREKGARLRLTDDARTLVIERGTDPVYGARPMRRSVTRHVQDPLADFLFSHDGTQLPGGAVLEVDVDELQQVTQVTLRAGE